MMPIRDLVLTLTVLGLLPVCFVRPWIGVLVWSWLSYMNPHRLSWGFAYDMPFAMLVGVATLGGLFFTKDRKPFLWRRETIALVAMWGWFTVTTLFAMYPDDAREQWIRISKIVLMVLITVPLFQDRSRVRWLLLVIAGSIGFYAFKGAQFVIGTGGNYMILGAPGATFISSNNAIALALNMCLPIFLYLAREEPRRWVRFVLWGAFGAAMFTVPFTYSRGGVLGLAVVLALLFLRTRGKILLLPGVVVALLLFSAFTPEKWALRMQTIWHYQQDMSAMSRLAAWSVGLGIAGDRPVVGGGFWVFNHVETWFRYAAIDSSLPIDYADAHSIYFNLLGEHGWVGLGLFAVWTGFTLATLRRLRRTGRAVPELAWIGRYAHMLQASILAYLITGAFLSVAYFDLAYHLMILVVVLQRLAEQQAPAAAPARRRAGARHRSPWVAVPATES